MNMQFGRAALRAKELAIRGALGSDTLETRQADADRKSGGRGTRSRRWSSVGLLERRLTDPRHGRVAVRIQLALLDSIYDLTRDDVTRLMRRGSSLNRN